MAIEGFTGSRAHELASFDIRAKLVEPEQGPTTRFMQNTLVHFEDLIPGAYADFATPIFAAFAEPAMTTKETDVAEAVWAAVHDTAGRLRFPAGPDAVALAATTGATSTGRSHVPLAKIQAALDELQAAEAVALEGRTRVETGRAGAVRLSVG